MTEAVYSFQQAEREAEAFLAQARAKAQEVLRLAAEQIRRDREIAVREGREKGYQDGLAQGRCEGLDAAREDAAPTLAVLQEIRAQWEAARGELLARAEQDVAALAMAIAEKIVLAAPEADPGTLARIVRRAVEQVVGRHRVEIRVHPDDRRILDEFLPDLKNEFLDVREIVVAEDPAVGRGGAVVRTETGEVDARLDVQLEEVRRALYGKSDA